MVNFVNSIIRDIEECLDAEQNFLSSIYSPFEDKPASNSAIATLGKIDAYQRVLSILNDYPHD